MISWNKSIFEEEHLSFYLTVKFEYFYELLYTLFNSNMIPSTALFQKSFRYISWHRCSEGKIDSSRLGERSRHSWSASKTWEIYVVEKGSPLDQRIWGLRCRQRQIILESPSEIVRKSQRLPRKMRGDPTNFKCVIKKMPCTDGKYTAIRI